MVRSLLLGAILALSLGANAQMGGGPGGGPGGPGGGQGQGGGGNGGGGQQQAPPPPCNPNYDLQCYKDHPENCAIAGLGDPSNPDSNCYIPPEVSCDLIVSNGFTKESELSNYLYQKSLDALKSNKRFSDFYMIQAACETKKNNAHVSNVGFTDNGKFNVGAGLNLPSCDSWNVSGWCIEDRVRRLNNINSFDIYVNQSKKIIQNAFIIIQNKNGSAKDGIQANQITFSVKPDNVKSSRVFNMPREIKVAQASNVAPTCRVIVSGAVDNTVPQVENALIEVTNGAIEFRTVIDNASGPAAEVKEYVWSGGPTQNGVWEAPPPNQISTVSATVRNGVDQTMKCSLRIKPQAEGFTVKVNKFGDCAFFTELRNYYFLNQTNKAFQAEPFSPTIKYPGIDVEYGQSSPEVPFAGILNGAASVDGQIIAGMNGLISVPPASIRKYTKAILVAKVFDTKAQTVSSDPIYWGVLDYSNYANTRLIPTPEAENVNDNDTIVFQMFLAGAQPDKNVDLRGQENQVPFYDFIPAGESGRPFDKIVPFMNDSCIPMFQISMPQRKGKPLTPALKSAVSCTYSRPYKFQDLKSGRVGLTALHIVPEHGQHQFPTDLLKASFQPPCVAQNPNDTEACWNVKATDIGQNNATEPYKAHESCRQTKVVGYSACDKYGCYQTSAPQTVCKKKGKKKYCTTVNTPVTIVSYQASCNVIESANECTSNLAIRFSGYNQMSVAALGCAVKYDKSGEVISPTLAPINSDPKNLNGIIPYSAFGGSPPKDYRNYPATLMSKEKNQVAGYACIPCRFASSEAAVNRDIYSTTGTLPVDQDASTARKPLFSFQKLSAPRECVREISMEVRYFGSSACDGVSAPPGNFCSSENISQQSCPSSDTSEGGGNIAGKFKVKVCPGSGFEYDSVSVSWSPIIVDVAGNGIEISRDFKYSVGFDIKGNGTKAIIDWPVNTREVAFLVRPNKAGKVESIKELFGDYKAKNGFEALRPYDTNKDGTVDSKDKRMSELSLWFDLNRNAVVDEGEIVSLDDAGIESISLKYNKPLSKGIEGKTLSSIYFNRKSNRFMNVEDHYFYEYMKNGKLIDKKKPVKKQSK